MVHSIFEYNLIQEEDRRMKLALAKKLKADRKKRKQTIAEILSGGTNQKSSRIGSCDARNQAYEKRFKSVQES